MLLLIRDVHFFRFQVNNSSKLLSLEHFVDEILILCYYYVVAAGALSG